jgi:hypothetical protein
MKHFFSSAVRLWGVIFCAVGCTSKQQGLHDSSWKQDYDLVRTETLTYPYSDSIFISRLGTTMSWRQYIIAEDVNSAKLWVFDKKLHLLSSLGGKGNAPGEFLASGSPCAKGDSLYVLDAARRSVSIYDSSLTFIQRYRLPPNIPPHGSSKPFANGRYFVYDGTFVGGQRQIDFNKKYMENHKSLFVTDTAFKFIKDIYEWDDIYQSGSHETYSHLTGAVNLCFGHNGGFFAQQAGTYLLKHFDAECRQIQYFGRKPNWFKEPPPDSQMPKNPKPDDLKNFIVNTSFFYRIDFDPITDLLYVHYWSETDAAWKLQDMLMAKNYLQVYDTKTYNCVFEGEIPGIFQFVADGKAYILTSNDTKQFTLRAYQLRKKSNA